MRTSTFILVASLWSLWSTSSGASSDPQAYAHAFVGMLKSHQFELASREFYYPQSYTSQELAADQATMVKSLAALIGQIGDLRGDPEPLSGLKLTLYFGISGGDKSHPTPELDTSEKLDFGYAAQAQREGSVRILMTLVNFQGQWHVLRLKVGFSATDSDAAPRVKAIIDAVRRSNDPQRQ